jgi:hypothetical protein
MGTSTRKIEISAQLNMIEQNLRETPSGKYHPGVAFGPCMSRHLEHARQWNVDCHGVVVGRPIQSKKHRGWKVAVKSRIHKVESVLR